VRLRTIRELGLLVRTERKRQRLSMQEVAERVGCTRQWVAALEAGRERLEVALVLRTLAAWAFVWTRRAQIEAMITMWFVMLNHGLLALL
jgi:transcriptional regulator with XRE-family HTH domain